MKPRVLVTRPLEQAREFCDLLAAAGFEPVCLPAIAIQPVEDTTALDAALSRLPRYDWIVLASANAARVVFDRLRALGQRPDSCPLPSIVAGPATAQVLAEYGVAAALVPARFSAEAALEAMQQAGVERGRVLLPRAEEGGNILAAGLRDQGVVVDEVVAYRTVPAAEDLAPVARDLAAGVLDAVTFFSPSAVRSFAAGLEASSVPAARLARLLDGVAIACIGPTTAAVVEAQGWRASVDPPETTAAALAAALAAYFHTTPLEAGAL